MSLDYVREAPRVVPRRFSYLHALGFAVMHAALILIDFADLEYWWLWLIAVMSFFIPELHGAFTGPKGKIDTLSQMMWAFLRRGWTRIPVALGWIGWVMLLAAERIGETKYIWGVEAAGFSLLSGVALWLVPHFIFRGRYG